MPNLPTGMPLPSLHPIVRLGIKNAVARVVLALGAVLAVMAAACSGPAARTRSPSAPAACSSCQAPARVQGWREDIAYLATRLPAVRKGGLGEVAPAAWRAAATRLEAEVPRLTDSEVIVGLARMIAMLHDDETRLDFPGGPVFHFDAQQFGGGLYLLAVPPQDRALLGAQLLAMDGHPIAQVLARAGTVIDAANPQLQSNSETGILDDGAILHALGITRSDDSAVLTVRTRAGLRETIRLTATGTGLLIWPRILAEQPGLAHAPLALYEQHATRPYWMRVLAARHTVYLKYNQCLAGGGFGRLANRALALLLAHPDYRLIIDLRDNGGGDSFPLQLWLYDAVRAYPQLSAAGRLIVLVNQFTDSSGTSDAQALKDAGATLIGQPPADPRQRWGDIQTFPLPTSGLTVEYTTHQVFPSGQAAGLPDIVVAPTLAQTLAGDDPVLTAALTYQP